MSNRLTGFRRGAPQRRRLTQSQKANVLIWALASALALFFVIYPALGLGAALQVASGHGTRGYWTATNLGKGGWDGTFRLADGKVLLSGVQYEGSVPDVHAGTTVPGTYAGGLPSYVYPRQGSQSWKTDLFIMVGAFAFLLFVQVLALIMRRRGRKLRASPRPASPFVVHASSFGGGHLRWYRFKSQVWFQVVPVVACLVLFATLLAFLGGPYIAIAALLGVIAAWLLFAGVRAGIGVGTSGVTVRSALGWSRHAPWQTVTGFQDIRPTPWQARAGTHAVAVICSDQRPLTTSGCWYQRLTDKTGLEPVWGMIRALEAERAAIGPGPAAQPGSEPGQVIS
jgi:hypothetical protein